MSSLIDVYANVPATWRRATGMSASGTITYSESPIATVWDETRRLVRDATGEQVTSEARALTTAAVKVGDFLIDPERRAWRVLTVSVHRDVDGSIIFREAML